MGICSSCDASASEAMPTAKLILPDGSLQEYAGAVRASRVLLHKDLDGHFVCNADDMEFDGRVCAADSLALGEIYFALPRSMLRRRILPEEMAALAVRASAALVRSGAGAVGEEGYCARKRAVVGVDGLGDQEAGRRRRTMKGGRGTSGRGRRGFVPDLSAIAE